MSIVKSEKSISCSDCEAARKYMKWCVSKLSRESGVQRHRLTYFLKGIDSMLKESEKIKLYETFEAAGVEFVK